MNYSDTTIIVPTFNEEENIYRLLITITRQYKDAKIIVSDDGSKDKTKEIVKRIATVNLMDRSEEQVHGLTASVIDAIKQAKTRFVVIMDADFQHPPEKIRWIVDELRKGANIAIGRREKIIGWPLGRRIISDIARFLGELRLILRFPGVKDVVSGFFGANVDFFRRVLRKKENRFEKQGYKVLFDLLKYCPKNTRIAYVGYTFRNRKKGGSKIGKKQILIYLRSLFK